MEKHKRGRDAATGEFIRLKDAERRKKTAIVETYTTNKRGPKN